MKYHSEKAIKRAIAQANCESLYQFDNIDPLEVVLRELQIKEQ